MELLLVAFNLVLYACNIHKPIVYVYLFDNDNNNK